MLGWNIRVYRQLNGGALPTAAKEPFGTRLAVWQTGSDGLSWIDELVTAGKAIDLGGIGYQFEYTATAKELIPRIIDTPPGAHLTWVCQAEDIITDEWEGKTVVDHAVAAACDPDEWLLIEAWDES